MNTLENFSSLNLPESLNQALTALNFSIPTPIQAAAIPVVMEGGDLIACAQTGTGKTAAYLLPILTRMAVDPNGRCLVLVPTRELAAQVHDNLRDLGRFMPELRSSVLIGGTSMIPQLRSLQKNPRIIVATPGRLLDHIEQKSVVVGNVRYLVLDEADRMLDLGFAPQIAQVARHLPTERQTLLFSATVPPNIRQLANKLLRDPKEVTVSPPSTAPTLIEQKTISVEQPRKNEVLLDVINEREGSMLVFTRTKSRADRVKKYLNNFGVNVSVIHGDRSQAQRKSALDGFKTGKFRILVATDIAARGIDVDHVAHVVNYDLPYVAEDYVHRIGRTGRAGRTGSALSLISAEEQPLWSAIERLITGKRIAGEKSVMQSRPQGQKKRFDERGGSKSGGPRKSFGGGGGRSGGGGDRGRSSGGGFGGKKKFDGPSAGGERSFGNDRSFGGNRPGPRIESDRAPMANADGNSSAGSNFPRPRTSSSGGNRFERRDDHRGGRPNSTPGSNDRSARPNDRGARSQDRGPRQPFGASSGPRPSQNNRSKFN